MNDGKFINKYTRYWNLKGNIGSHKIELNKVNWKSFTVGTSCFDNYTPYLSITELSVSNKSLDGYDSK